MTEVITETVVTIAAYVALMAFIVATYGRFGLYACVALVINVLMILGVMAIANTTLTLPGIAAIAAVAATRALGNVRVGATADLAVAASRCAQAWTETARAGTQRDIDARARLAAVVTAASRLPELESNLVESLELASTSLTAAGL